MKKILVGIIIVLAYVKISYDSGHWGKMTEEEARAQCMQILDDVEECREVHVYQ